LLIFGYTWEKISETWSCGELYRERLGPNYGHRRRVLIKREGKGVGEREGITGNSTAGFNQAEEGRKGEVDVLCGGSGAANGGWAVGFGRSGERRRSSGSGEARVLRRRTGRQWRRRGGGRPRGGVGGGGGGRSSAEGASRRVGGRSGGETSVAKKWGKRVNMAIHFIPQKPFVPGENSTWCLRGTKAPVGNQTGTKGYP